MLSKGAPHAPRAAIGKVDSAERLLLFANMNLCQVIGAYLAKFFNVNKEIGIFRLIAFGYKILKLFRLIGNMVYRNIAAKVIL